MRFKVDNELFSKNLTKLIELDFIKKDGENYLYN